MQLEETPREIALAIKNKVESEYPGSGNRGLRTLAANDEIRKAALRGLGVTDENLSILVRVAGIHKIQNVLEHAAVGIATKRELKEAVKKLAGYASENSELKPHVKTLQGMRELQKVKMPTELTALLARLKKEALGERMGSYQDALYSIKSEYEAIKGE
ncbi:hypothetical protein COX86_03770 [Candidatus Micrarchaeota archaeon CG_4_10_14_0_2_um_filter_60_11]|nr:MAG: hypothetical protein AUJ16_02335 [Candidatus Micrarchaeota archaeon CG1_02_60_51]PIN96583.1 MAG: hypothetical protein COU39_00570 [Candidatus Micrarchaeota archaeon CG10_big_fil_rev_8_21_14_0_10_60_32]PIO02192.1 MAG: hypothetical protein COT58_01285 [Candidatus Micrarchaeota archaeon CG09_land_8_20_14_0_10_60_16]PIY91601.1 MAG: hypothetical protein COY71_02300 [Candidatus Micrarchaeota archaeon CG_4_10_14_0_8_um_filter_60_7]PIZ90661.1 MAG: hypothetical protein COX86_03770 [Candidatus Mi